MDTHIAVLPLYQAAEPYILALWVALLPVLVTWLAAQLQARTNIRISAAARDVVQQAALNAAGRVLAAQEGRIADLKFDVKHPAIAAEVPKLEASVGDAIAKLGMTPERVADLVQAKVGQLQAVSAAVTQAAP